MAPQHLALCLLTTTLISAPAASAEAPPPDDPQDISAISCDTPDLPQDLAEVCDRLAESMDSVMSRRLDAAPVVLKARRPPSPSLVRRPLQSSVTVSGLVDTRDKRNPFETAPDRALGVQISSRTLPVSIRTELVQPGDPGGAERLNWELSTRPGVQADQSGAFAVATAGGTYDEFGTESSHVTASAGLRQVVKPLDGVQITSEIAPNHSIDGETITGMNLTPRLTTSAQFPEIGRSDLRGTLSADLGYNLPMDGGPSAQGGFRLTLRPKN